MYRGLTAGGEAATTKTAIILIVLVLRYNIYTITREIYEQRSFGKAYRLSLG